MNKTELINTVSQKTELNTKDVSSVLNAMLDVIKEELSKGNEVKLTNFGTFKASERSERKGRNPQTGEELTIPATKVPTFKAGKGLKTAVK